VACLRIDHDGRPGKAGGAELFRMLAASAVVEASLTGGGGCTQQSVARKLRSDRAQSSESSRSAMAAGACGGPEKPKARAIAGLRGLVASQGLASVPIAVG